MNEPLGEFLRSARRRKGLSLRQTAGRQLTPTAVWKIEQGRNRLAPDTLIYLVQVLDLSLSEGIQRWLASSPRITDIAMAAKILRSQGCFSILDALLQSVDLKPRSEAVPLLLHEYGQALIQQRRYQEALQVLCQALEAAIHQGAWSTRGHILMHLGMTYRHLLQPVRSIRLLKRALLDLI